MVLSTPQNGPDTPPDPLLPAGRPFCRVLGCFGLLVPTKVGSEMGQDDFFVKSGTGPIGMPRHVFVPETLKLELICDQKV